MHLLKTDCGISSKGQRLFQRELLPTHWPSSRPGEIALSLSLFCLGEPEDPLAVWKKLSDQFQKKTWANKLGLRRRLYSLKLKEGDAVQEHIRQMMEIFEELAIICDPVNEEDRVVHLLASLPESYNMLVTALEANADVPQMAVVTERLLHEEKKQKDREDSDRTQKVLTVRSKNDIKCYYCKKAGHIMRDCYALKKNTPLVARILDLTHTTLPLETRANIRRQMPWWLVTHYRQALQRTG